MSLTENQIGPNGPPIEIEHGSLSYEAGLRLAEKVNRITPDSNPFSVILPAKSEIHRPWVEQIQAAHDRKIQKRHVDLGKPVVVGFFAALGIDSVDKVFEFCKNHEPPLEITEENLDFENPNHYGLLQYLDAVPYSSVVVTFSAKVEETIN